MKQIFLITISLLLTGQIFGQKKELPSGKIEVVSDFEVKLTESQKVLIHPDIQVRDTMKRRYDYVLNAPSPNIEYLTPELKPIAINPETKARYYPFYARLGYGNPNAWLWNASYDHTLSSNSSIGAQLDFESANNKKIPLQKFNDFHGNLHYLTELHNGIQITGYVNADRDRQYLYGADDIPDESELLLRQYLRIEAGAVARKYVHSESLFGYNMGFVARNDKEFEGASENGMIAFGGVEGRLGINEIPFGIDVKLDVSRYRLLEKIGLNNLTATPFIRLNFGELNASIGAIGLLSNQGNAVLPDINVKLPLSGSLIVLRGGWSGSVIKNNYRGLSLYNPYVADELDSLKNELNRAIYLGLDARSGRLKLDIEARYNRFKQMAFFLQDKNNHEEFQPIFDNGSYIGLQANVGYRLLQDLEIRARYFHRFYSLKNEDKPWHRPTLGIDGSIVYSGGEDKYHVSATLHTENGLPYRTPGGTELRLKGLLDLNIHADYFITDEIGAFAQINNIVGNKRARWVNYPSFGFNAKIGVMVRLGS